MLTSRNRLPFVPVLRLRHAQPDPARRVQRHHRAGRVLLLPALQFGADALPLPCQLGGFLVHGVGAGWAFLLDAGTFAFSVTARRS